MPPLHAIMVHFPVSFLLLAGVFHGISFSTGGSSWRKVGFYLQIACLLVSVGAILTGDYEASQLKLEGEWAELVATHENMAMLTTWGNGLLVVWCYLRQEAWGRLEQVSFVVAMLVLLGMLGFAAHLGGELVYLHGIGLRT